MLEWFHLMKMDQNQGQENNKVDLETILIGICSKMENKCFELKWQQCIFVVD